MSHQLRLGMETAVSKRQSDSWAGLIHMVHMHVSRNNLTKVADIREREREREVLHDSCNSSAVSLPHTSESWLPANVP